MRQGGLAPDEGRRQARAAFGGVQKSKKARRDGRGFAGVAAFSLDLKLAIRLLARYPWLTLVGGAAMAFGIAATVGAFEIGTQLVAPSLPLDEGSRIVGIRKWDASTNHPVLAARSSISFTLPVSTNNFMAVPHGHRLHSVCRSWKATSLVGSSRA